MVFFELVPYQTSYLEHETLKLQENGHFVLPALQIPFFNGYKMNSYRRNRKGLERKPVSKPKMK